MMFGALAMLGSMGMLTAQAINEEGDLVLSDDDRMQELQALEVLSAEQIEEVARVYGKRNAKVRPATYAPLPDIRPERKQKSSSLKTMLGRKGRA